MTLVYLHAHIDCVQQLVHPELKIAIILLITGSTLLAVSRLISPFAVSGTVQVGDFERSTSRGLLPWRLESFLHLASGSPNVLVPVLICLRVQLVWVLDKYSSCAVTSLTVWRLV